MNQSPASDIETVAQLRAFLLGTLPEVDVERLEHAVLADDGLYDLLLATEEELIDEYVRGALSEAEASSFRGYLDRLPAGRARIDFARELQQALRSNGRTQAWWRSLLESTGLRVAALRRPLAPAWAGALGLAAATLIAYVSLSPDAAPLILNAGLTRGEGALPAASLSDVAERLPLMLELGHRSHPRYRATLYDAESREVLTLPALEARVIEERILVPCSFPARGLAPGDYSIVLDGETADGPFEPVARYVFRLTE
jgi:hypothetical protein